MNNNALKRLKVNLKNWSWNVESKYTIDKNEAKEIIEEIEELEEKEDDGH